MGNYDELKQAISDVIKTNGNEEITGQLMQNALLSIINVIGANSTFAGIATIGTNPGTPDQNVFYISSENGIYVNFGNYEVKDRIVVFKNNNGQWVGLNTNIPTYTDVSLLKKNSNVYNVSSLYPNEGIDGTLYYDLQTAINVLNEKDLYKPRGCKVQFLTSNSMRIYEYLGNTFNDVNSWIEKEIVDSPFTIQGGILKSNGLYVHNETNYCTNFIPINQNSIIIANVYNSSTYSGCAFYDKSYQYISSFETNNSEHIEINTDNIPSDAKYIRLTCDVDLLFDAYVLIKEKNQNVLSKINTLNIPYYQGVGIRNNAGIADQTIDTIYASDYIPISEKFDVSAYCIGTPSFCLYAIYDKYYNCIYTKNEEYTGIINVKYSDIKEKTDNAAYIRFNLTINPNYDIVPYIIGYSEIDIISIGKNDCGRDFFGNFFIYDGYIKNGTGKFIGNNSYISTDYIKINKDNPIILRGFQGETSASALVFYDSDYNYISRYNTTSYGNVYIVANQEDIPQNAVYIRCTSSKNTGGFISNSFSFYEIYKLINDRFIISDLFVEKGKFISKSDGSVIENQTYKCTNYIPFRKSNIIVRGFEGGTSVSICSFFDKDRKFISSYSGEALGNEEAKIPISLIPENTYYIRCSASNNDEKALIISDGISLSAIIDVVNEQQEKIDILENKLIDTDKVIKAAIWEIEGKQREQQLRQEYIESGLPPKWYGVEWGEESNPDNVIAINSNGDENLHIELPIQNKMRRCVTKDGILQYYLSDDNSEEKATGGAAILNGSDGDVMVEIPEFFYKCEEEEVGGVRKIRLKISEQGLPDFEFSRKRYTSAYEATVNRTTNRLASVCTTLFSRNEEEISIENENTYVVGNGYSLGTQKTALRNGFDANAQNFRGGTNDASLDNENDPQSQNYSRNQLGIPVANVNREDCRNLANTQIGLFMDLYDTQKTIWILAQIEYKTRNIQKAISDGGLGKGATVYPDYNSYEKYFSPQRGISCLPCGVTNVLGNKSGEVYYRMINVPIESTGAGTETQFTKWGDVWMPIMSYRGIENFYGHIYKIVDQVNLMCEITDEYVPGHEGDNRWRIYNNTYYYEKNPYLTNNIAEENKKLGTFKFSASIMCVSSLLLGKEAHILHIYTIDKNYNNNYCDCSEFSPSSKLKYLTFNGRIVSGQFVGFHFIVGYDNADGTSVRPSDGTRLNHF